ncbi:putative tick transposon, partial [Operophtera brumata]
MNYDAALVELQNADWSFVLVTTDANEATVIFLNHLVQDQALEKIEPWVTPGLIRSIRKRDNLRKKCRTKPNDITLQKTYRQYRKMCNHILKTAKPLWQNIKQICNIGSDKSNGCSDLLKSFPTPDESVNMVNNNFSSVGSSLAEDILAGISAGSTVDNISEISINTPASSFALYLISEHEIISIINSLKSHSAPGWDGTYINRSYPDPDFQIKIHSCENFPRLSNCSCPSLMSSDNIKYLGVYLDRHLRWDTHINNQSCRIRKLIFIFKSLRLWGGAPKTNLISIERAQRGLIKVMLFKKYRHSTKLLYHDSRLLTVRQLYILN